jgi:hypothetical protein
MQQKWAACGESLDTMKGMLEPSDLPGLVTNLQLRAGLKHDLKEFQEALTLLNGLKLFAVVCFSSLKNGKECVDLCEKAGEDDLLLAVYDDLGMVYNSIGDKENTLKYFELARRDDDEEDEEDEEEK